MMFDNLKRSQRNTSPHPPDVEPDMGLRNESTSYQLATDSVKIRNIVSCAFKQALLWTPGQGDVTNMWVSYRVWSGFKKLNPKRLASIRAKNKNI